MIVVRMLRVRVPVVLLLFSLAVAQAEAQQSTTFQPQVGQAGKDVVWVPTPQILVDKMLDLAKVTPADYLVDLGSGDGITVITAAKRGVRAMGIEYDPAMVELSKQNAQAAAVGSRASFIKADIFETDFSDATVVTLFLLPSLNLRLRPTILAMKPGTRVVSNTFSMEEWDPDERVTVSPCERWCTALFWIVPAQAGGTWSTPQGDLTLSQTFQKVAGSLGSRVIADGIVSGYQIKFSVGDTDYVGRIDGNRIEGTYSVGGRSTNWTATRR